ncbi:MAG: hypothetical protein P4N59_00220 [Negativicutes bacterium]|nr:hypothetical protein [Negativicutes bacterium]
MRSRAFRRNKRKGQSRRSLLTVLTALVLASGMYYNMPHVSLAPADSPPPADNGAFPAKSSFTQYQPDLPARDPFAIPAEFLPKAAVDTTNWSAPATPTAPVIIRPKEVPPVLTGVIVAGNSKSAILQYGADSRSYQKGDFVGPYQISAINQNSVTLRGPNGTIVVSIGR